MNENNCGLDHILISRDKCADKWVNENNFGSNILELIHWVFC